MMLYGLRKRIQKKRKEKWYKNYSKGLVSKIEKNCKKLPVVEELSPAQKAEIKEFFKTHVGEDVPLAWHKYFTSRTGVYSKEYIPTALYKAKLVFWVNKVEYRNAYADKNMIDVYLPNANHPEVVVKNMNGYFYSEGQSISREEAIIKCTNLHDTLIKPSLERHGDGIRKLSVENGITNIDGLTIGQVFDRYGMNFCIQKFIHQHERMKALNPTSVNTIRIVTYRSEMEILVLYTVIRIGRAGKIIDNESAGGISVAINDDGKLAKYAYGDPGIDEKLTKTDTGVVLEGYDVPSYHKAVEVVKKQHFNLPFFDIVGWDIAINEDGEPIIIEWNVEPELSQSAYGPGFGKYTERVLDDMYRKKLGLRN